MAAKVNVQGDAADPVPVTEVMPRVSVLAPTERAGWTLSLKVINQRTGRRAGSGNIIDLRPVREPESSFAFLTRLPFHSTRT